jgi:Cellulase (glycosyl hydrolase family 5)
MTARTIAYLKANEFTNSGSPGRITPQFVVDAIDTVAGMPASPNSPQTVSYTASADDANSDVDFNSATPVLYTIPPNSSVPYDVGTLLIATQIGAGMVSFAPGAGVTFTGSVAKTYNSAQQYSIIFARKTVATDTWNIFGDLQGRFFCRGGQIIDPTGATFVPKGINLADWGAINASGASGGTNNGALLPTLFPRINFVRLTCQGTSPLTQSNGNDDPAQFATFIANCTKNNIVVLVENHNAAQTVLTGGALTTETAWYVSWANAYGRNPYVWFGTMNEPQATAGNQALITTQQVATYNGIRGTGCRSIITMSLIGGYTTDQGGAGGSLTAASYTTMTNVVWDLHYYNWLATAGATPYTANYSLIASTLAAAVKATQAFATSADGVMPLYFGEFGNSAVGSVPDPGGTPTILAVQASGYGGAAWTWFAGASDRITDGSSNLTGYGLEIAAWIAGAPTSSGSLGSSLYGQTANPLAIANASTVDVVTIQSAPVATFNAGPYFALNVTVRNQTNSACFSASFMCSITRGSGSATIVSSSVFGEIGTASTITMGGSGVIRITFTSIAADGSSYHVTLQNTSADIYQVWLNIAPSVLLP